MIKRKRLAEGEKKKRIKHKDRESYVRNKKDGQSQVS